MRRGVGSAGGPAEGGKVSNSGGQEANAVLHPLPAVLEGATRQRVLSAQKSPANTARDAMEGAGGTGWNQKRAGVGHGASMARQSRGGVSDQPQEPSEKSESWLSFASRHSTPVFVSSPRHIRELARHPRPPLDIHHRILLPENKNCAEDPISNLRASRRNNQQSSRTTKMS